MERANACAQKRMEATTKKRNAVTALLEFPIAKRINSMVAPVTVNRQRANCRRNLLKTSRHLICRSLLVQSGHVAQKQSTRREAPTQSIVWTAIDRSCLHETIVWLKK